MTNTIIAVLELVWVGLFIGFWTIFFVTDSKSKMTELEYKHELSFPFPDLGWVTPCLAVAAIGLLMNHRLGYFFSALAGSGMMFLGIIDLAFDLQNRKFAVKTHGFEAIFNMGMVALILSFGLLFIVHGALGLEIL